MIAGLPAEVSLPHRLLASPFPSTVGHLARLGLLAAMLLGCADDETAALLPADAAPSETTPTPDVPTPVDGPGAPDLGGELPAGDVAASDAHDTSRDVLATDAVGDALGVDGLDGSGDAVGGDSEADGASDAEADATDSGSGDLSVVDAGPTGVPLEELVHAIATAFCQPLFDCRLPNQSIIFSRTVLDSGSCAASAATELLRAVDLLQAIEAGTIQYDPDAAETCLAEFAVGCLWSLRALKDPVTTVCASAFQGMLGSGAACWRTEECAGDAYCDHSAETGEACPGVCVARKEPGAVCTEDYECARTAETRVGRCVNVDGSKRCFEAQLAAPAGVDSPCGLVATAGSIETWVDCEPGLWCTSMSGLGSCKAPIPAGGACASPNNVCADGHLCVVEGALQFCKALTLSDQPGLVCVAEDPAGPRCNPTKGLRCVEGVCEAVGDGSYGSPCLIPAFGPTLCQEGLVCDFVNDQCVPPLGAGQPCTSAAVCASGDCGYNNLCLERVCR